MGRKVTLQVRLPTQEMILVQFDQIHDSYIMLKKLVCRKIGLPDTESIMLSYQGKSLRTTKNLALITKNDGLSTI